MTTELITEIATGLQTSAAPYFEQYLGVWALRETEMLAQIELIRGFDLSLHLQSAAPGDAKDRAKSAGYSIDNGVATILLTGSLMKQVSSFSNGTSTVKARRAIREAMNDDAVNAIMLYVDSPGGTVAGTKELADDIAAANKRKPVVAFIEDLGASAAYWISSQAGSIATNETALVGSIGTYGVVNDLSALAAKEGIKVHVVRAGKFKGMGVPGTEVNADHLAEMQRMVDGLNSFFLAGVSAGRKMQPEQVAMLADGRTHIASEAKRIGLIDSIATFENTFDQLVERTKRQPKGSTVRSTGPIGDVKGNDSGGKTMSDNPQGPKPATIAEIKAECVGASSDFVLAQAEANATIEQAKSAWMKSLAEQNATMKSENEKLAKEKASAESKAAQASAPQPGKKATGNPVVDVVGKGDSGSEGTATAGPAKARWDAAVKDNLKVGMTGEQAVLKANRDHPGLRAEMLAEVNPR